ncbi:DUF6375 family protein [Bradyrhizobium oligotrophicum]|uniref:DUF6375 family protein n=1 Tax=Bradyrhizobium oligotrophicum TaxID=44255 RepID=UPI003EC0A053
MIGSFKQPSDAAEAEDLIAKISELAQNEPNRSFNDDPREARFSKEMLDFFMKANLMTIGPSELEQFSYEVNVERQDNKIVLKTDESDVSAFLKLLIDRGARVEIFSAHEYPDAAPNRK